jgi:Ca-activated chloride channel family protein
MIAFADLLQIEWRNPWWLLVALQPLALALLLRLRRQRLLHYADAHLLPWAIRVGAAGGERPWRRAAHLVFWLLVAGALAGPRLPIDSGPAETGQPAMPRHEMDVMVVLDVSPSMRAQDVAPDRLSRAKLKLADLVPRLRGERIGMIAFSGEAGMLMPPTRDTALLGHFLELARPDLFEDAGTYLAGALRLAQTQLTHAGEGTKAILLVTDGEASALSGDAGNAAIAAARELKQAGVPLFVLAVGTAQGGTIPLPDGGVAEENGTTVMSRLDAAGFATLAESTGGKLAEIVPDEADLDTLYDRGILTLPARPARASSARAWRELYPWLLVPALLLWGGLQYGNRRAATALAAAALLSTTAQAEQTTEHEAYQAYRAQDYLVAQHLYTKQSGYAARMGEGASAYRRKDFGHAVRQFTEALLVAQTPEQRADALFNLGNSYYLAGNKPAALDSFQGVLRYRKDEKARANLARVSAQMKPAAAPPGEGVSGRRGRGLGEGANEGGDAPMGMEEEKERPQVLMEPEGADAAGARRQSGADAGAQGRAADLRAARKKLELVRDQPQALNKRLLTQDRGEPPAGASPW